MCGRFATRYEFHQIEEEFNPNTILQEFIPRVNVAPSQDIPVIIAGSSVFDLYKWGLVPHWAKDSKQAMINARSETIMEKPWFKSAFLAHRCLIPVSGFYEWDSSKTPHYIQLKNKNIFALAGIASLWKSPSGEIIKTCCIITVDSNDFMQSIHHRMPAIIKKENYNDWLHSKDTDTMLTLLKPFEDKMTQYPISKAINNPRNESLDLLKKADEQMKL